MARRWRVGPLTFGLLLFAAGGLRAADVPEWLQRAATAALPAFDAKVPAVVLHDHGRIVIDPSGRQLESLAYAVKILSREGRAVAVARAVYATDSDKVRELNAWIVRAAGAPQRFGKKDVLDLAVAANDVYNEARVRLIDATDDVAVGDVFGFEVVVERGADFNQLMWTFQQYLPVRSSRCELTLPPGWTVKGTWLNHAPVETTIVGLTHAWELRDLPYVEPEPAAPGWTSLAPRLALSFAPPAGSEGAPATFDTWQDVARWTNSLHDPRAVPDATVTARARELTSGLANDLDRIRAIARFVQRLPYISIQIGLGRFQPHPAPEILAKAYGDCKDKANLMRALLSVVGIPAYPVLVSADDPRFVRSEWPSPTQFNHAILAIRSAAAAGSPAAFVHPTFGPLLIFDPTDEHTLPGDLPEHEQGGSALLAAGDASLLLGFPSCPRTRTACCAKRRPAWPPLASSPAGSSRRRWARPRPRSGGCGVTFRGPTT